MKKTVERSVTWKSPSGDVQITMTYSVAVFSSGNRIVSIVTHSCIFNRAAGPEDKAYGGTYNQTIRSEMPARLWKLEFKRFREFEKFVKSCPQK